MSRLIPIAELPKELNAFQAVEAAYPAELQQATDALLRGLPVLVECDKGLVPYFYKCLRDRLKSLGPNGGIRCQYLDGRAPPAEGGMPMGLLQTMITQLRDAVRGVVDRQVLVLPHLDLLTTSTGALTSEAREVIPLMYENPQLLWCGFRDPSFALPRVIRNLFPHQISILGTPRDRLKHLVTQREGRKFGPDGIDLYQLYKQVSGVNAARLRQVFSALEGEDFPENAEPVWDQIRQATLAGKMSVPKVDLFEDIGGYQSIKERIDRDILKIMERMEASDDEALIKRMEALVPRGMIFWGPPGTGKTLFAKAIASSLGAAVQIISGPELKSKWVGESEERIRQLFVQARQSAPALIIFDELDSFASARGTYTGSGIEHSMVNQLLTELDGFRSNELVFVVGTTNFPEALDPALLRPGRFEFQLHIPFPKAEDRRSILEIYDKKLDLELSPEGFKHAVRQSAYPVEAGTGQWSGDHLYALCRSLARRRLRLDLSGPTTPDDIDAAMAEGSERPKLTENEELVVATHECGHAITALHCSHMPPIDRISIRSDVAGALGFVSYADPTQKYVVTHEQMLDSICVLFGGREAESSVLGSLSVGAAHDLQQATRMARALVEQYGYSIDGLVVRDYHDDRGHNDQRLAPKTRQILDEAVSAILEAERSRAASLLRIHHDALLSLRDLLLEKKVLEARQFSHLSPKESQHGD